MKKSILLFVVIAAVCCMLYHFMSKPKGSDNQLVSETQVFEESANVGEVPAQAGEAIVADSSKPLVMHPESSVAKRVDLDMEAEFSAESLQPVAADSPHLAGHANWPQAQIISVWEARLPAEGVRRVSLLQPDELPYPVRIEETFGKDGTLARRTEMVANRFVLKVKDGSAQALENYLIDQDLDFRRISSIGLYRVAIHPLTPDGVPEGMRKLLSEFSGSEYAEPDFINRTRL